MNVQVRKLLASRLMWTGWQQMDVRISPYIVPAGSSGVIVQKVHLSGGDQGSFVYIEDKIAEAADSHVLCGEDVTFTTRGDTEDVFYELWK